MVDTAAAQEGVSDPPRPSDIPTRPARAQVFQSLTIGPYRAVMRDDFWLPILKKDNPGAGQPKGRQLPWTERFNVAKPASEPYGSQHTAFAVGEDPTGSFLKLLIGLPQ